MKPARWLIPIVLLAFALRLVSITTMSLRADEASNYLFASQDLNAIIKQLVTDDPHPPLYFFLLHYWVALAGDSELAIRFPGVFAGTLIVALSALLGKILLPRRPPVAIAVAALAAINPSLIWDAQDAHLYPWLDLFSVASCVAFLQMSFRAKREIPSPKQISQSLRFLEVTSVRRWLAYVVISALALYSHYIAAFILIAQGVLAIAILRRDFFRWLAAQFAIGVSFLPWFFLAGGLLSGYQTDFFPPANFFEILLRSS